MWRTRTKKSEKMRQIETCFNQFCGVCGEFSEILWDFNAL